MIKASKKIMNQPAQQELQKVCVYVCGGVLNEKIACIELVKTARLPFYFFLHCVTLRAKAGGSLNPSSFGVAQQLPAGASWNWSWLK